MPTEKPRITFTISKESLARIDSYRFNNRIKNQTQAILALLEAGLADFESKIPPSISSDALEIAKKYERLDKYGKRHVQTTIEIELERMEETHSSSGPASKDDTHIQTVKLGDGSKTGNIING